MRLRDSLARLAALALDYGYENIDQYSDYLARKLARMIASEQLRRLDATAD